MSEAGVLFDLVRRHNAYAAGRVDLVASNAWVSSRARLALGSALSNSYCIGEPGNRWYGGCAYIDMIEREVVSLATRLFGAEHAAVQFLSGMQANIAAYSALLSPGDKVVAAPVRHGGHYSHGPLGPLRFFSPTLIEAPFDPALYNLDLDGLRRVFARERPRLLIAGWSEFLFPHPLREIRDLCDRYDVRLMYDMSHVAGLVAGGRFQPDAGRLADVLTSSTGKSLHAPDHGMLLYHEASLGPAIDDAIVPLLTSNTHPHELAAVGIALAEMHTFGRDYARQVVANTKVLGAALHERGVKALYRDLGYSESHTLLVECERAQPAMALLDAAGISCNTTPLPWDPPGSDGGLRLGTQVVTRRGMRELQMRQIADAVARLLVEGDDPLRVNYELVRPLAERFRLADYSFDGELSPAADLAALVPGFAGLSPEALAQLAPRLDRICLDDGERLFASGEPGDGVFFILDGAIAITDERARRVAQLGPGDHVGEIAVLTGRPRALDAHATCRTTLLRLTGSDFRALLDGSPAVRRHFEEYREALRLADRARAATNAA
jgi:glycine hydroxymethyltransferase